MASFDENGKYIKTNWKAGDKITATKLNKIEESIEAVNDNDISRHVEADARLDALEAKDVAHDKEFTNVKNLIADNKAAAELGDYEINSRMTFLENELNEGIEEVHNVAETVDGKIATAEANMTAMVAEVEADLEGLHAKDEELSAQLEHIEKRTSKSIKDFGAKGDGVTDDSDAFIKASKSGVTINLNDGVYVISQTIDLLSNTWFVSNDNAKIKLVENVDLFRLCYNNTIQGITIDTTNIADYTCNLFEVSSKTLENKGVVNHDNLRINIKEIKLYTAVYYRNGCFINMWATKEDEDGKTYDNYGFWGITVEDVVCYYDLKYFCKNYIFDKYGWTEDTYITGVTFKNITVCTSDYCFFGSKSEETINDTRYKDCNMLIDNVMWQYSDSKYFAFFTSGSKTLKNNRPFDIPLNKTFLLQYRNSFNNTNNGYSYCIYLDYEYGELETRASVNNIPQNIDKNNYIRSCFSSTSSIYQNVSYGIKTYPVEYSSVYPCHYKIFDYDSEYGTFTGAFMINLGYKGWETKGMTIITLTVSDNDPLNASTKPTFSIQSTPYTLNNFGKFYISKTIDESGKYANYKGYIKLEENSFGAGCYFIALNPPQSNIYSIPVFINKINNDEVPSNVIEADYPHLNALTFPSRTGNPWVKPCEGMTYFNATTKKFMGYNGDKWVELG